METAAEETAAASSGQTMTSVERAADVLLLFGRVPSRTLGITEIAHELAMSKAGVHRVLASLRGRGLIEFDERTRRYLLGPALLSLGLRYLAGLDVRRSRSPNCGSSPRRPAKRRRSRCGPATRASTWTR